MHPILKNRRSPVLFSDKKIAKEDILGIFEAARWSPSSSNQQPWRYIIAPKDKPEDFQRLFNCLTAGNKLWVKNVPLLCISIAEVISDYNYKENRYAFHDVGLSTSFLIFQAMSLGIYVHVMGGFNPDMAVESLNIPERFSPVAMIAMGYPADSPEGFPAELITKEKRKRVRKEIPEILFNGLWGNNFE